MISVSFLQLVEVFHQDCASDEVERLAASLVSEISLALYLTHSKELKVVTANGSELSRYENIFRFLQSYGLGFGLYPLSKQGHFILAVHLAVFTPQQEQVRVRALITGSEKRAA